MGKNKQEPVSITVAPKQAQKLAESAPVRETVKGGDAATAQAIADYYNKK